MRYRSERVELQLLEDMLRVLVGIADNVAGLVAILKQPYQSTSAVLGVDMPTATLTFTDDAGNPAAPPTGDGSGLVVTFASDNPAVSVGTAAASGDAATAEITGTDAFNLSATVANASGAPLLDDDGVTAFVAPAPIAVASTTPPAPQAVTAVLSTDTTSATPGEAGLVGSAVGTVS